MHTTTLHHIMEHSPCAEGFTKLRDSLPPIIVWKAPITFEHILNSNGIHDALWAIRVLGNVNEQAEAFILECLDEIEKEKVRPNQVEGLRDYVARNRKKILAKDYTRMSVGLYWQIALELPEDKQIALFRKHFCTPGVTYGPYYTTE